MGVKFSWRVNGCDHNSGKKICLNSFYIRWYLISTILWLSGWVEKKRGRISPTSADKTHCTSNTSIHTANIIYPPSRATQWHSNTNHQIADVISIMACYCCYYNTVYYKAREIYNKYKAEVGWSRSLKPHSIHKLSFNCDYTTVILYSKCQKRMIVNWSH